MRKLVLVLVLSSCGSPKTCREISDESRAVTGTFKISDKFIKTKARWLSNRVTDSKNREIRFVGIEPMYDRADSGDWHVKAEGDTVYNILKKAGKKYFLYRYYSPCLHDEPLLAIDSSAFAAAWYERLKGELRKNRSQSSST